MARIRLRKKYVLKRKNMSKLNKIILVIIAFVISLFLLFQFLQYKVLPILMNYAELEVRKLAGIVINKAMTKHLTEDLGIDDLFIITKNDDGEIKTIDFNPVIVNKILTLTTNTVHINLRYIEQGHIDLLDLPDNALIDYDEEKLKQGIIYEIPTGVVFNNVLLSNLGPKIPVKLNLVGDILSNVHTEVTNYGINNALIEVNVNLELTEQILLPFMSKEIKISVDIPVALKLIQGTVPNYYLNGINQNSASLTIPVE